MAFFPCIYFTHLQRINFTKESQLYRSLSLQGKYNRIIERQENRARFLGKLTKLVAVCELKGFRLIIENPKNGYLELPQNFVIRPKLYDNDRTLRGDFFRKPTAYWFLNCDPTHGETVQKLHEAKRIKHDCRRDNTGGICNEERSMISPDYARNFICDFIIGKKQVFTQPTLFD